MCKNCTDQPKAQNGDLSEDNSLPSNCTKDENKSRGGEAGGSRGDNKDEGCVYCRDGADLEGTYYIEPSLFIRKNELVALRYDEHDSIAEINYCPMCGRKL